MLVVVTGSYRPRESNYNFHHGKQDLFEQAGRGLGAALARGRHTLWVAWTERNVESQLGKKERDNHPYTETADFYALIGFLAEMQANPRLFDRGARVRLSVSAAPGVAIHPFAGCEAHLGGSSIASLLEVGWIEQVTTTRPVPENRTDLLLQQAKIAEMFIVLGGGKAAQHAIRDAQDRCVLLPLAAVGGVAAEHLGKMPSLQRALAKAGFHADDGATAARIVESLDGLMAAVQEDASDRALSRGWPGQPRPILLFLAAQPEDKDPLNGGAACDAIKKAIGNVGLALEAGWSVRPGEVQDYLNQHRPRVLHFHAHGDEKGRLALENPIGRTFPVRPEDLALVLGAAKGHLTLVFFAACNSLLLARAAASAVGLAVGVDGKVEEKAIRELAARFYGAITAGVPVQGAFDQAKAMVAMEWLGKENNFHLVPGLGVDPATIVLL